ncbi:MAG TPA: exodeoxyribonuclease VII large subunit, partial [Thermoleophilia bacterium]|nr:exodeoxyribonuclease VII large subunit [Thermoleophilia bacterium]
MNQRLFSPDSGPGEGSYRAVSLVRLAGEVARALVAVGKVSVEGEVHRPNRRANGRVFFTLRERAAQLSVTVPPAKLARCRVVAGERVLVSGALSWFTDWGQLLFVADEVSPVGEGAVAAAIAEARRRLDADGLLARPRRRIPRLPSAIGVICGTDAAVRADIESVVAARFPGYPIEFREVTVQGPGAAEAITTALQALDARPEIEVIVLARGGGDAVSLLPFSDEELCRAVAASRTAVVAAIGHEGDRPLIDEVADLRAGTPSLAAAAVVPDRVALEAEIDALLARAALVASDRVLVAGRRLDAIDAGESVRTGLGRAADRLERQAGRLELLHPARRWAAAAAQLA